MKDIDFKSILHENSNLLFILIQFNFKFGPGPGRGGGVAGAGQGGHRCARGAGGCGPALSSLPPLTQLMRVGVFSDSIDESCGRRENALTLIPGDTSIRIVYINTSIDIQNSD